MQDLVTNSVETFHYEPMEPQHVIFLASDACSTSAAWLKFGDAGAVSPNDVHTWLFDEDEKDKHVFWKEASIALHAIEFSITQIEKSRTEGLTQIRIAIDNTASTGASPEI